MLLLPSFPLVHLSLSFSPFYEEQHLSLHILLNSSKRQQLNTDTDLQLAIRPFLWAHLLRMELGKIIYDVYIRLQIAFSTFTQIQ